MQDSIRVGIAGLGTVGSGVAKILLSKNVMSLGPAP